MYIYIYLRYRANFFIQCLESFHDIYERNHCYVFKKIYGNVTTVNLFNLYKLIKFVQVNLRICIRFDLAGGRNII